jgi:hypothetical protein
MAWKIIKVKRETYERIFQLCNRWNLSATQVIERLLQLYEAYLEGDHAAKSVVNEIEATALEMSGSSPREAEPAAAPVTQQDELRQVVADMLYVTEAVVDMLGTIVGVYPDLRAECGPIFDRLYKRFDEVALAWNLMPAPTETQETEQEAEGEAGGTDRETGTSSQFPATFP